MRIEYKDGRSVGIDGEDEARAILDTEYPHVVYGDWELINEGRDRLLVWSCDEMAGSKGCGDDGSHAVAEIVRT